MWKDPIVEEVRKARQEIAAECDYDFKKMLQRERNILKNWKGKVVTKAQLDAERNRDRTEPESK